MAAAFLVASAIVVNAALLSRDTKMFCSWTETGFGWDVGTLAYIAAIWTFGETILAVQVAINWVTYCKKG